MQWKWRRIAYITGAIAGAVVLFWLVSSNYTVSSSNALVSDFPVRFIQFVTSLFSPPPPYNSQVSTIPTRELKTTITPIPTTQSNLSMADFARCLTGRGLKMYGTSTCPNCKAQKELFKEGVAYLKIIDCDVEVALCNQKRVTGYPTWEFPDGKLLSGVIPMSYFSQVTGCMAPRS